MLPHKLSANRLAGAMGVEQPAILIAHRVHHEAPGADRGGEPVVALEGGGGIGQRCDHQAIPVGQDLVVPTSGVSQWQSISGGITRDTVVDAFKIMPRTPSHLEVHTVLINNVTIREITKWGRDEMGGDFSQDLVKNGWSEQEFMNARWIITIKRDLVPDDSIYMFSDPKFIGKSYLLEDTTMYIKREAFMLEFFAYETTGGALGNTSGLARADFV